MLKQPRNILALLVFFASLAYFGSFVGYGINFEDEGTLLYQAERVADGQTPYIDFHIGYTPAVYYLHAGLLRLGDYSIIPGRWLLAVVNSLTAALLTLLALRLAPLWIAWLPAALLVTLIPNHAGSFASFNIPYPVWYNCFFFVSGLLALMRFGERGSRRWLFVSGLLAGADFMFKPNVGLLHLAAASFVLLSAIPQYHCDESELQRKFSTSWWWLMWTATLAGVWLVFSGNMGSTELGLFLLPATVAASVVAWRASVSPPLPSRPHIVGNSLVLAAAFFAVNVPWMAVVIDRLGLQRFLHDVLFIGADFEKFYYISHPPVLAGLAAATALAAAAFAMPRALAKRGIRPELVLAAGIIGAAVAVVLLASRALMPEGFDRAVLSQLELQVFPLTLFVLWLGLFSWMGTIGVTEAARVPSFERGAIVLGALFMYLQVYPRTDYMHWVGAAPLALVLVAVLLAPLVARWSAGGRAWSQAIARTAWLAPLLALMYLRASAPLAAVYDGGAATGAPVPAAILDNARAPVWINEGKAVRYAEISAVAEFLNGATEPGEKVFTFPMLDLISFLSDRDNPTRHGYFYPYWPGREVEAEVVAVLRERPPRFAVVYHDHAMFFVQAPIYYYAIDDFLTRNYHPYASIGRYLVLAHNELGPAGEAHVKVPGIEELPARSGTLEWIERGLASRDVATRLHTLDRAAQLRVEDDLPLLTAALEDPVAQVRDRAVWALRYTLSPEVVSALAQAVRKRALSPRETIVALRHMGKAANMSNAYDLLQLLEGYGGRATDEVRSLLFYLSERALARSFWIYDASPPKPVLPARKRLRRQIAEWISDPRADSRLRGFAIGVSAALSAEEAVPRLHESAERALTVGALRLFGPDGAVSAQEDAAANAGLRIELRSTLALIRRGAFHPPLRAVAAFLGTEDMLVPQLLILGKGRNSVDRALAATLESGSADARVSAAWVAALAGGDKTAAALADSLHDPDPDLRKAALAGLQALGASQYRSAVQSLLADPDYAVREFAARAARALAAATAKEP